VLFDLNVLVDPAAGWTLEAAYGINDAGQIVGWGWYGGRQSAFRLDPVPSEFTDSLDDQLSMSDEAAVPEPSTFGVAAALLCGLAAVRALWHGRHGKFRSVDFSPPFRWL
jgi:hypothetical protein